MTHLCGGKKFSAPPALIRNNLEIIPAPGLTTGWAETFMDHNPAKLLPLSCSAFFFGVGPRSTR